MLTLRNAQRQPHGSPGRSSWYDNTHCVIMAPLRNMLPLVRRLVQREARDRLSGLLFALALNPLGPNNMSKSTHISARAIVEVAPSQRQESRHPSRRRFNSANATSKLAVDLLPTFSAWCFRSLSRSAAPRIVSRFTNNSLRIG